VKTVAAKIDLWTGLLIEIPATVGVIKLITGWKLLKGRGSEKALMIMSTLGLTALTFTYSSLSNAYGRYQSALQKDWK
jgi:predicted acyltransferase